MGDDVPLQSSKGFGRVLKAKVPVTERALYVRGRRKIVDHASRVHDAPRPGELGAQLFLEWGLFWALELCGLEEVFLFLRWVALLCAVCGSVLLK